MITNVNGFAAYQAKNLPSALLSQNLTAVHLYSPYDDVHGALVAAFKAVKAQLVLAMYGFDDDELAEIIAQKMADEYVHCQITLDKSQAGGVHEKALLDKYGYMESNSVAIGTSEKGAIMHRKMAILDQSVMLTGSTNFSTSAETKQDNQLTITSDQDAIARANIVLGLEHTKALTQMGKA